MAVIARGLSTWLATIGSGANKKKIIIAAAPPPPVSIQTGKEESKTKQQKELVLQMNAE